MAEASWKSTRIDAIENALKGVVGWGAIGEIKKLAEPIPAFLAEEFDLAPILAIADDGADGDDNNVDEWMSRAILDAGIFEVAKVFLDRDVGNGQDSPP